MKIQSAIRQEIERQRGAKPRFYFSNWAKTYHSRPQFILYPETEAEIVEIIAFATEANLTVKLFGAGHSPSSIACGEGIMVSLDRMNRVLEVNEELHQITVEGGIRLKDLVDALEMWNLGLSSLGSIAEQSIAGAISTGTHGTGMGYGPVSKSIVELWLVDGLGETRYCSATTNVDLFSAARCGLGALGVIVRVTIQCEPAFCLRAVQEPTTFDRMVNELETLAASAEHVRFWWLPHTPHAVLWRANRTDEPVDAPETSTILSQIWRKGYELQLLISRYFPANQISLAEQHFKQRFSRRTRLVRPSREIFALDCLFFQRVNEWAVPLQKAGRALQLLRDAIEKRHKRTGLTVHFPIEIRFSSPDDAWLSPAYGHAVCYIGIISYRPFGAEPPYKEYWADFENIMRTLGARPHWAKAHRMYPADWPAKYPKYPDFMAIRAETDPNGVFLNKYLTTHLLGKSIKPKL